MPIDVQALRTSLCNTFCQEVGVVVRGESIAISIPMTARDGDGITAYLEPASGGFRVSDKGATMMRLSYEHDLSRLLIGVRAKLFETILHESGLQEQDGEIYIDVAADGVMGGLFSLGQGLTRVEDVGLWTKSRVESTFNDDLREILRSFIPSDSLAENYIIPELANGDSYPIDFYIATRNRPLYVFGVNGGNKARLATLILLHLQNNDQVFESLVVCSNIDDLPKLDRNRLLNAANDVVPTIYDKGVIRQKIEHRMI